MCAIQSVNNASSTTISKMLMSSEQYAREATGVWHGSLQALFLFGVNQKGLNVIGIQTETFAGSGGARTFADGVDLGGELPNPITRMSNVETVEATFPIRYLFRRRMCDSAGPGQFRGGTGGEYAITPHDAPVGLNFVISGKGFDHTMAEGIAGGYPAPPSVFEVIHRDTPGLLTSGQFATSVDELFGQREPVPWGTYPLNRGDVLYARWSGGGGFGDPLKRDPESVCKDVLAGLVSARAADEVYGVVLNGNAVDLVSTKHKRAALQPRPALELAETAR
jgi:N-methylhydantoinase B